MKYLFKYVDFLVEKTSLSQIKSLSADLYPILEKEYEISLESDWQKVKFVQMVNLCRGQKEGEVQLFLQISINSVKVFIYLDDQECYLQRYFYYEDDFGSNWEKEEREKLKLIEIIQGLNNDEIYWLKKGEFSVENRRTRKNSKLEQEFDELDNRFRKDVIDYLAKYEMDWYNPRATVSDSLSDLDRSLIEFEMKLSQKKHQYLLLNDLVKEYGYEKVKISFLYYLKTKKIKL